MDACEGPKTLVRHPLPFQSHYRSKMTYGMRRMQLQIMVRPESSQRGNELGMVCITQTLPASGPHSQKPLP
jgi:hypothetical protein